MGKSRVTRVPKELWNELTSIKQAEKINRNIVGFKKIASYARIGREIANKDLLNANVTWFNIQNKKRKKM